LPVEGKKGGEEGEAAVGCKTFGLCAGANGKATMETLFSHEGTSERSDKTGREANRNKTRSGEEGRFGKFDFLDRINRRDRI
jgi:hypothetical protein